MLTTVAYEPKHKRIYMDYAAATPVSTCVREAMAHASKCFGNPSSIHEEGRAAQALVSNARSRVAQVLGATPEEIIFTASGSEADALALLGAARANRAHGSHVIVSAIEHKAILKSAKLLEEEGFRVTYLRPDSAGLISGDALKAALCPDTIVVSIMYANNEIGTVEPIRELCAVVREARRGSRVPLFHTDASQAPGLLPINAAELGVDLLSLNGAKAYGPKGVGALYCRRGTALRALVGGEQERGLRGGTENVELIVGLAKALEEAEMLRTSEVKRLAELQELCITEITRRIPGVVLNGHRSLRLPNNVHVSFPYIEGESILLLMDAAGVACATGSACNSFDLAPSHVLLAIGNEAGLSHGSVRLSFGRTTTKKEVLYTVESLVHIVTLLRSVSALTVPLAANKYA